MMLVPSAVWTSQSTPADLAEPPRIIETVANGTATTEKIIMVPMYG
jgi:hypothetical protein